MIPFLDLSAVNKPYEAELKTQFDDFLKRGHYIMGQQVKMFETNFASYCNVDYCVGTANGLDALTLIFKAYIQLGKLNEGDEVLVPANTYIASILSVMNSGLVPVLVEPDEATFNISPQEIKQHISPKVKAIMAVHLYGQLADMVAINQVAETHGLLVIEDAAQAHGAMNKWNKKAGNLSDAAAFSFYPSKNLGALGDAGAMTTNDEKLADMVRLLHNYGSSKKYENKVVGYNSRLDEFQAMFLNIKLKGLDRDNKKRRVIANRYATEITNSKIVLPHFNTFEDHVFHVFVVRVVDRPGFANYLSENKVGSLIHYPIPPHKQEALRMYESLKLPITEAIHDSIISIPMSPVMTENEVTTVINILNRY